MSPPGRQDRPSGKTEAVSTSFRGDNAKVTLFGRLWPRVVERRRASRELDALLGVRSYPDIAVTYGLRSLLEESSW